MCYHYYRRAYFSPLLHAAPACNALLRHKILYSLLKTSKPRPF